jgi:hypothetical protein
VLRNDTLWAEFSHTVLAAFVTGAMIVLGVSGWQLLRGRHVAAFTRSARLAAGVALACTVLVLVTGDIQARLMDIQQPMKMAAAEAVYRTQAGASFSLLTIGNLSGQPAFHVRSGRLRTGAVGHVLELSPDSWVRLRDAGRVRVCAVAVHRDGTPAMDRVRPDEDPGRGSRPASRPPTWRSPWAVSCCFTPCSGSSTSYSCSAPSEPTATELVY